MRISLGARLVLSYLAVILLNLSIAVPLAWLAVERLYLSTQRESLLAQAQYAAAALRHDPLQEANPVPYTQSSNVLPGIHSRVIDAQGGAVIDLAPSGSLPAESGLDLPQLAQNAAGLVTAEELLSRPEIAGALAGQATSAIRRVEAARGGRVLYAAAPVLSEGGVVTQIIYLATPLPNTQWAALPAGLRWQFGAALLAAVLFAGAAGLLLARRISHPLSALAASAHGVAAGDLTQKVPEDPGIREFAAVGRAFNTMTASLRQADQAKTAFISDVSHELRTPLTVIKGSIETLQDGALEDLEARDQFLASMSRETERLIRLVNDLLVLTRADAGALNLQLRPINLAELAGSRCAHLEQSAKGRQVHLRTQTIPQPDEHDPGQSPFLVMADADRLAQVLDNLLDNAIRYSPSGGEVLVTISHQAGRVACQVRDSGPGIPAQHLPFLFDRFYRADPARGRSQGGSGLGLSIVRSLVQSHSGQVTVDSIEGQGATFTFWLPAP